MDSIGLVLSGGGARGAYQAGVLSAISEVAMRNGLENPFLIYSGVSAGSINAAIVAGFPGNFQKATSRLTKLWSEITTDSVFYADLLTLSRGSFDWVADFSFPSLKKAPSTARSIFSTTPLRSLLTQACHFENIQRKIDYGNLQALAISTLDYDSISSKTFFQAHPLANPWDRPMHRGEKAILSVDHVMASSAIPMFFPPVKIDNRYYGDGCIRNQSPCAPAIYLGARRLVAVGVRRKTDTWYTYHHSESGAPPSLARLINVIFHSVMMDGLEADIQRITQTNSHLALLSDFQKKSLSVREVDCLWISPSVDFSKLAIQRSGEMPRLIRYLLSGFGSLSESSELVSYLLFDGSFCQQLIEIGFADGMKAEEEIKRILSP
ncbi:patatin-like phospholipase family protein [Bdellovibrio svalbardensis]|uniref:Patatin-like phospholipase family protein n=1 Tax=Bdellovibrio svalbardensis TaxID=2972972 RepID=A0ABT6DMX8_9BACT|nr:patatin-like phospholipase family protein [Bdellovibrio svalbardensis]MDG0817279.1 patatin-like phospholipase family protein [Bdellovibrio svalbardensis]